MPKERVWAEHDPMRQESDDPSMASALPGLEVQWGPYPVDSDSDVGVCIGTGHLNKSGLLAEDPDEKGDITFPFFVWMNRRELNRVIAMLRRARRATYGEDE